MNNTETKTVPAPLVIRELINSNNQLLRQYQDELTSRVIAANKEIMLLMGLNPDDGWRLDMNSMTYTKVSPSEKLTTE